MSAFSPSERYLQNFHGRVAGATSSAFGGFAAWMASREYRSSYDVLASLALETPSVKTVLDVACGDGHLLGLLLNKNKNVRLIGVDMSEGELNLARKALPPEVVLLNERAQTMSVETGAVDVVLSHMALMLMDDIGQVMQEIRRVLRPGGTFGASIGRTFLLGEVNQIFLNAFKPIAKEDLSPLPFGDSRTRSMDGWTELLRDSFDDIRFEDIDVPWSPTPDELWQSLGETYDVDRLSVQARTRLKDHFMPALSPLQDSDGTIRTGWGLRLVHARAR